MAVLSGDVPEGDVNATYRMEDDGTASVIETGLIHFLVERADIQWVHPDEKFP